MRFSMNIHPVFYASVLLQDASLVFLYKPHDSLRDTCIQNEKRGCDFHIKRIYAGVLSFLMPLLAWRMRMVSAERGSPIIMGSIAFQG